MGKYFDPEAHLRTIDARNAGPKKAVNHHHPLPGQVADPGAFTALGKAQEDMRGAWIAGELDYYDAFGGPVAETPDHLKLRGHFA